MHDFKISILIPTFNRSARLAGALSSLFEHLNSSKYPQKFEIVICDNGSTDETEEEIGKFENIFIENGFVFKSSRSEKNLGFDINVAKCIKMATTEYIWFLSDDDNILNGALDNIVESIIYYQPNVIIYNFDQTPYKKNNPLIKCMHYYYDKDDSINNGFIQIIKWPKFSSLVLKRDIHALNKIEEISFRYKGFIHMAVTFQTILNGNGRLLANDFFLAAPDLDFMDNIDFMPNIGDNIVDLFNAIKFLNKDSEINYNFKIEKMSQKDALSESLKWLTSFYIGKMSFKLELLNEIKIYIVKNYKLSYLLKIEILIPTFILLISYFVNKFYFIIKFKSLHRIR
jgi:glycosyltransferase involved in cell wall biosynthesis